MPKVTEEFLTARREEIIDACARLYETMSFREITLKEIGQVTSFNRTSIYNYFNTKEEIFLALMQREYERWSQELAAISEGEAVMTRETLAEALAHSLEKRGQLLKLLSMNLYDIEDNSRAENLAAFKTAFGGAMTGMRRCLDRFCPEMTAEEKQEFLYAFFPFLFGIYPYTVVSDKQREAMEAAGLPFVYYSVYEITLHCLQKLLGVETKGTV